MHFYKVHYLIPAVIHIETISGRFTGSKTMSKLTPDLPEIACLVAIQGVVVGLNSSRMGSCL